MKLEVTLCMRAPRIRRGSNYRLWAFGFEDIAALLGVSARTVRKLVKLQSFDPRDLESVCKYWESRRSHG